LTNVQKKKSNWPLCETIGFDFDLNHFRQWRFDCDFKSYLGQMI
jgi:hypothetical protein